MRNTIIKGSGLLLLVVLLIVSAAATAEESEERNKLLEQQKVLVQKVDKLKREQEFLIFEKMMYSSDSKYIIINLSRRTGQLKYKNRVLKDFHVVGAPDTINRIKPGIITLTKKIESARQPSALVFNTVVLQKKSVPQTFTRTGVWGLGLQKKDFIPVFYAIEEGAKGFIIP